MYYNSDTIIFNDGKFSKAEDTLMDLYGQTLHYGYGAFEGIRAYNTPEGVKIFKAAEHYDRLHNSCNLVNIPLAYTNDEMTEISYEVLHRNNFKDAYLRPLVYCNANMNLSRPRETYLMICAWEWGAYLGDKMLRLIISSYCRPHPRSTKIEAKICGHYVNSILATTEAKDNGYDEALLLDSDGFLAEGPGANLFFEKNGVLYTPAIGNILPGITRATVLELCQELNIEVHTGFFTPDHLNGAEAAFFCGTAAEVVGIASIDRYIMTKDWSGTMSELIQQAYRLKVKGQSYSHLKAIHYAAQ